MAIKVKRKQSRHQAAKEPDQIYTFSERAFNALEKNRKIVLASLAIVLVLIIAVTLIARQASKSSRAEGASLMSAAVLVDAPLGGSGDDETTFGSVEERAEAVRSALAEQLQASSPPAAARLLDAISSAQLGDMTRAGASYQALADAEDETPMTAAVARQGLAATEAAAGDQGAAQRALQRLTEGAPRLEHFARLERARLAEAAGDLQRALEEYETVASTAGLVITDTGVSTANEALVETARHRAAVLGVVLGEAPEPTPEEPTDAVEEAPEPEGAQEPAPEESTEAVEEPPAPEAVEEPGPPAPEDGQELSPDEGAAAPENDESE